MYHVIAGFKGQRGSLDGRQVTARGLHGCLFSVLQAFDMHSANWLHGHDSPKPYSIAPIYAPEGHLLGLRMAALTERTAELLVRGWQLALETGRALRLGPQVFTVRGVEWAEGPDFALLAQSQPQHRMVLRFLSPTVFKQGRGTLPLPLPHNVFAWPLRVWLTYAPAVLQVPDDWLEWCGWNVYVTQHRIETADVALDKRRPFTGFVGDVMFDCLDSAELYMRIWDALGSLAAFSGVGYKTTMGMGAVERVEV